MFSKLDRDLLATYVRPELRRTLLLGFFLLAGIGFQLANPLIAGAFIDGARGDEPFHHLLRIALVFTAVAVATQAAAVAETYVADDLGWRTTNALRVDLTRHVLSLDASFHASHNAGELTERIDGDVSTIAGFFSRFVVQVVGNVAFLLGVLLVLFAVDWRIGGALTGFAVAALLVMTRAGGFVSTRSRAARAAVGDLSGYLEERLSGLPDLKSSGADAEAIHGLHDRMAARFRRIRASVIAAGTFSAAITMVFVFGTGASLALSTMLLHRRAITLGTLFAVFRYTGMLRYPLEQLARQMNSLQQATGGIVRVRELLDTRPSITDGPGAPLPGGALSVDLDQVSFAYEQTPVLRDVSLSIEAAEVVGILGRTGSGKTTISRLLFRLHDPTAGAVRIGGIDLREMKLGQLRARIGLVTQDVQIFDGTLRDNVTLFDDRVADARLADVFTELGLDRWVSRLPSGLASTLGHGGVGLSAGEAQLVAFARVFLADPGVVILDEASSRLDPATEQLLELATSRLLAGRTGIVIAHRIPTVDRTDRIVILDAGTVAEAGRRADLAADPASRFAQLRSLGLQEALT